jgi:hypothetical protein
MPELPFDLNMIRFLAQRIHDHLDQISKVIEIDDEQFGELNHFVSWIVDHNLEYLIEKGGKAND